MDRKPVTHGGVFSDEAFASEYARKHWKMAAGFGKTYGRKLKDAGFAQGRVLDVGCGFGATILTLAKEFPETEFLGIDLSEPLLGTAREAAQKEGVAHRVRFQRADVQDIPFEADSFDALINLNMAHLVENPGKMMDEMERVLRPDGFLFMADLKRSFLWVFEKEIRAALSSAEARELIRESDLRPGGFSSGWIWWRYAVVPQG